MSRPLRNADAAALIRKRQRGDWMREGTRMNWNVALECRVCGYEDDGHVLNDYTAEELKYAQLDCPECEAPDGMDVVAAGRASGNATISERIRALASAAKHGRMP